MNTIESPKNNLAENLFTTVRTFLKSLAPDRPVSLLVAFSGGPDSTALLQLLAALRSEEPSFIEKLEALYVDHRLRTKEELSEERETVTGLCKSFSVQLHIASCREGEIEAIAQERQKGVEEAARFLRYAFLEEYAEKRGLSYIATAHTADDQQETMLMRFLQGKSIESLRGIAAAPVHSRVIRPLLEVPKQQLIDFLKKSGTEYSIDSTNRETLFLRNSLRPVLAELNSIFPGLDASLSLLRERVALWNSYALPLLDSTLPEVLSEKSEASRRVSFDRRLFYSLNPFQRQRLLYRAWEMLNDEFRELPFRLIRGLLYEEGAEEPGSWRIKIFEFLDTMLCIEKNRFFWIDNVVHPKKNRYLKVVDTDSMNLFNGCSMDLRNLDSMESENIFFYQEMVEEPLVVRSVLPGDRLTVAEGDKLISKLMKDWRIPAEERWKVPILEDRSGILAVIGKPFGGKNRITKKLQIKTKGDSEQRMTEVVVHSSRSKCGCR